MLRSVSKFTETTIILNSNLSDLPTVCQRRVDRTVPWHPVRCPAVRSQAGLRLPRCGHRTGIPPLVTPGHELAKMMCTMPPKPRGGGVREAGRESRIQEGMERDGEKGCCVGGGKKHTCDTGKVRVRASKFARRCA
eukprot:757088-Hanusia_phi.AAC.11